MRPNLNDMHNNVLLFQGTLSQLLRDWANNIVHLWLHNGVGGQCSSSVYIAQRWTIGAQLDKY